MKGSAILSVSILASVAACGGGGGSNSMSGPLAFSAAWSGFATESNNYTSDTLLVVVTDTDLSSACSTNIAPSAAFKELAMLVTSGTAAKVAVGDFDILSPTAVATPAAPYAEIALGGYSPAAGGTSTVTAASISGKVTLTSLSAQHASGTFSATMEGLDGGQTSLSGSFGGGPCGPQG